MKVLNIGISTYTEENDKSNIFCKFQLRKMHIFFKMATKNVKKMKTFATTFSPSDFDGLYYPTPW